MFQGEGGLGGLGGLGRLGGGTTETGTRVCGLDGSPRYWGNNDSHNTLVIYTTKKQNLYYQKRS